VGALFRALVPLMVSLRIPCCEPSGWKSTYSLSIVRMTSWRRSFGVYICVHLYVCYIPAQPHLALWRWRRQQRGTVWVFRHRWFALVAAEHTTETALSGKLVDPSERINRTAARDSNAAAAGGMQEIRVTKKGGCCKCRVSGSAMVCSPARSPC